ncbi:hypothetical protein CP975_29605 [Streptomyces alboniger]|uniref:Uncharacterized protein n=1 Tax=Streptomyces alboniger TaxID=132473 RepID=A0A5J6HS91_STRAD|nr:hypothetical protein CP975_29605 [Streptomyces alboniger]
MRPPADGHRRTAAAPDVEVRRDETGEHSAQDDAERGGEDRFHAAPGGGSRFIGGGGGGGGGTGG